MGGIVTVDPWLLDLAERGTSYRVPAHTLALMQHHISRDHGHIVELNTQILRNRALKSGAMGKIPRLNVRCLRCGCAASLTDWVTLSVTPKIEKGELWEKIRTNYGGEAARFTQMCPGGGRANMLLEILESYARDTL